MKIDEPSINEEIVTRPAEHEIFLSFVNDEDAVLFYEWWNAKGFKAFAKWAEHDKGERGR